MIISESAYIDFIFIFPFQEIKSLLFDKLIDFIINFQ